MDDVKFCGRCKKEKSVGEFGKNSSRPDGLQQWCKVCWREYVKDYEAKNPDKLAAKRAANNARSKERYADDQEYRDRKRRIARDRVANMEPEAKKAYHRKNWLWAMYRLRPEALERAKDQQNGRCACCNKVIGEGEWIVDHCHDSGLVRGLVCRKCNNGLGSFGDSVEELRRAIAYLEAFNNRLKEQ